MHCVAYIFVEILGIDEAEAGVSTRADFPRTLSDDQQIPRSNGTRIPLLPSAQDLTAFASGRILSSHLIRPKQRNDEQSGSG